MSDSAYARIQATPLLRELYGKLSDQLDELGVHQVQHKKSSLHITCGSPLVGTPNVGTPFVGTPFVIVHPRISGLLLSIVTDEPLAGARVRKVEQLSTRRVHNEVLVNSVTDFDDELVGWLAESYRQVQ